MCRPHALPRSTPDAAAAPQRLPVPLALPDRQLQAHRRHTSSPMSRRGGMGSIPPDINPHLGLAGSSYGTVGHRIQEQAVR